MGPAPMSAPSVRPSWYALETGGWRDYVTLLHPPYTAWHLSYVVIGGCLAPVVAWGRLTAAVVAFGLAVGIGAHALDELRGRPLRTSIPSSILVGLAALSLGAACARAIAIRSCSACAADSSSAAARTARRASVTSCSVRAVRARERLSARTRPAQRTRTAASAATRIQASVDTKPL